MKIIKLTKKLYYCDCGREYLKKKYALECKKRHIKKKVLIDWCNTIIDFFIEHKLTCEEAFACLNSNLIYVIWSKNIKFPREVYNNENYLIVDYLIIKSGDMYYTKEKNRNRELVSVKHKTQITNYINKYKSPASMWDYLLNKENHNEHL